MWIYNEIRKLLLDAKDRVEKAKEKKDPSAEGTQNLIKLCSDSVKTLGLLLCVLSAAYIALRMLSEDYPSSVVVIGDYVVAIGIFGSVVSTVSVMLTYYITFSQDKQLYGIDHIAQELLREDVIRKNAKEFFMLGGLDYKCYREHKMFNADDLVPLTPISEDYAVQIVQEFMAVFGARFAIEDRCHFAADTMQESSLNEASGSAAQKSNIVLFDTEGLEELFGAGNFCCWFKRENGLKQIRWGVGNPKDTNPAFTWNPLRDEFPTPYNKDDSNEIKIDIGIVAQLKVNGHLVIVMCQVSVDCVSRN